MSIQNPDSGHDIKEFDLTDESFEISTPSRDRTIESEADSTDQTSFAETALRLGGKSEEEAKRTGAVDAADDQVETLFAPQYQTAQSPIHRAVWERRTPIDLFVSQSAETPAHVQQAMERSLDVVRHHKQNGTILDENQKISSTVLEDLAETGYWGLLVSREFGGVGASFKAFAQFITRMAMLDPTIAGLASVHGCIGAVDPVRTFGTPLQKARFLPKLASGERLSAFALTEPCAGSDLTALRTTARLDGDEYVVNGEKLFITNVLPGRTIGLVCLIENKPSVLIVDLPDEENEHFQLKQYGLYALKQTYNQGILFHNLRVPAKNLLSPKRGDGLTIAYHGLNLGRISLCANAAGTMRMMLSNMLPWASFRKTYGESIEKRELVRRRIGRLAELIVGCDALVDWTSGLIDAGFRGEMECIIAKIFGSEAQKEAAIELVMKTHGGRSFLHGHMFGDNIHEFLAPCIYEGEGEMLGMAFFKSLVKQHGREYFEEIGMILQQQGIKKPNLMHPGHLWALKGPMLNYGSWLIARSFHRGTSTKLPEMPRNLRRHAEFATRFLSNSALEISATMRRHQLKLADRQCAMAELSQRIQDAVVILCTSLYGSRQQSPIIEKAAELLCGRLQRKLTGKRPTNRDFRAITELGTAICEGEFQSIAGVESDEILMSYQQEEQGV